MTVNWKRGGKKNCIRENNYKEGNYSEKRERESDGERGKCVERERGEGESGENM